MHPLNKAALQGGNNIIAFMAERRVNLTTLATFFLLLLSTRAHAGLYFDSSMLEAGKDETVADLSRFEQPGAQLPGIYQVDIFLNGIQRFTRKMRFAALPARTVLPPLALAASHDNTGLTACLTKADLETLEVNTVLFPKITALDNAACIAPEMYIQQAYTAFDFQKMRLDISIPQAAMKNLPRGWIPPERWNEGINAALLSYRFNGSSNQGRYGNSSSHYLSLDSGLNLGAWRLRDNSNWSDYQSQLGHSSHWQHIDTYIERTIIPFRSELLLGDSFTGGDVFDSLSFRGIKIASNDNMYPDTQRGFAPAVKGVAFSNAKVEIRQNGNMIYQTFVAPGAFEINDLYSISAGGDLEVTVIEAEGHVAHFVVPYSSLPVLQREGHLRYALVTGTYRSNSDRYANPKFMQASLLWGLPHNVTAYGGIQLARHYQAALLGTGMNLGHWGAVSVDVTQADSILNDGSRHQGQSVRFLYGRSLVATGTTFQLAGYRYSTQGFHTLDETALKSMSGWRYDDDRVGADGLPIKRPFIDFYNLYNSRRASLEINISQTLGDFGSLYITATHQTYWHSNAATRALRAGYSNVLGALSYNLSLGYSRIGGQPEADKAVFVSFSVPLDAWLPHGDSTSPHHTLWANYNTSRNNDGSFTHQAGLSGNALTEDNLSWNVSQGYDRHGGDSGNAGLDYNGTYGSANAGYSYGAYHHQESYGFSGGAVWHADGLTLGQSLGRTNVLVAAPGATGIGIENGSGIHTDWRGYTVVPYASDYQENRIALDINQLNDHTDLDNVVASVVPTEGAVVRADFKARTGVRVLMSLTHQGQPLPFGSTVSAGDNTSLVGDDGQVYLTGLPLTGTLDVRWGNTADRRCTVNYHLPKDALQQPLVRTRAVCR